MSVVTSLTTPRSCGTVVTSRRHTYASPKRACTCANASNAMLLQSWHCNKLTAAERRLHISLRFVIPTATCHVTMWRAHAQTPSASASLRHEASKRHLLYVIEQGHGRSGNNRLQRALQRARLGVNHVTPLVTGTVHPRRRRRRKRREKRKEGKRRGRVREKKLLR